MPKYTTSLVTILIIALWSSISLRLTPHLEALNWNLCGLITPPSQMLFAAPSTPPMTIILALALFKEKRAAAAAWNKQVFGNIFLRKRTILARLKGIQKFFETRYSLFLANLQDQLIKEYNTTLKQELDFWKIKSRILWLNNGDAYTKFFHKSTL